MEDDRQKLAPVLCGALVHKLFSFLRCKDFVGYRVLLNQQRLGRCWEQAPVGLGHVLTDQSYFLRSIEMQWQL